MNAKPIRVTDEADADLTNGAQWYAERSHTVAVAFVEEVYDCFSVIGQFPNGAPRVRGLIRQLPVSGFPFVVLYRPMPDHFIVLRIFHTSQHPSKKFRLPK
ncbi:MAG TPA: type II toxin-antitoxin system RelE/ParE family toxin [Flavobacteriales bacterium]|nr:type II toxin-antitoxin system RelE/ParE family toxin [Flavobacteriales bacterium]HRQ86412.1 type II toxin-antitoxin system RelE/ParE family toxin [Flavobacteriales bacterium]